MAEFKDRLLGLNVEYRIEGAPQNAWLEIKHDDAWWPWHSVLEETDAVRLLCSHIKITGDD